MDPPAGGLPLAGPARARPPGRAARPFDKQGALALPIEEGFSAEQARAALPDWIVTAAFHNVSAVLLEDPQVSSIDTDVLVLGDDRDATELVQDLAAAIPGVRGSTAAGFATRIRSRRSPRT
ncbi:hypothetical protein GCM10028867_11990 [Nocardioides pacificus]